MSTTYSEARAAATTTRTDELLSSWSTLSAERIATHRDMADHGVNSMARERLSRFSGTLGSKLAAIREELRDRGIEPPRGTAAS